MKYRLIFLISLMIISCYPENDIKPEEVIDFTIFPNDDILADGSTKHKIKVLMDEDADPMLRTLNFKCTSGSFVGSSSDKPMELETKAKFFNEEIFAEIEWIASTSPGEVIISCDPVIEDKQGLFLVERSLTTVKSEVATLELTVNAFSVHNNFDSEVTITGSLKNSAKGGVSSGVTVKLRDIYITDQSEVGGRYRAESLVSGSNSSISAIYTPGNVPSGQDIYIIGTVMNGEMPMNEIKQDTVILQITQSN
ncbi:MAG: hypothetical protein AAF717_20360 [Bacteroidota bacterium]